MMTNKEKLLVKGKASHESGDVNDYSQELRESGSKRGEQMRNRSGNQAGVTKFSVLKCISNKRHYF